MRAGRIRADVVVFGRFGVRPPAAMRRAGALRCLRPASSLGPSPLAHPMHSFQAQHSSSELSASRSFHIQPRVELR